MKRNKIFGVFGRKGSGKSHKIKKMISKYARVLVYDTMDEYTEMLAFYTWDELVSYLEKHKEGTFKCAYIPKDVKNDITKFCNAALIVGDCLTVIEEADLVCNPAKIQDGFNSLMRRGRHSNVDIVFVSQRPYGINRLLTSQSDELICFKMNEKRDIDFITDFCGDNAKEAIQNLKKYHYLVWTDGDIKINKPIN